MFAGGGHGICSISQLRLAPRLVSRLTCNRSKERYFSDSHGDCQNTEEASPALSPDQLREQLELASPVDTLQRIFLGPRAVQRSKQINERLRDYLSNPDIRDPVPTFYRLRKFEQDGKAPLVVSMDLLRYQIKNCVTPEDITRVLTVALRHREGARLLSNQRLQGLIQKKLDEDGPEWSALRVLICLNLFISKMQAAKFDVNMSLIWDALKAAASCYEPTAVKRLLRIWRDGTRAVGTTSLTMDQVLLLVRLLRARCSKSSREDPRIHSRQQMVEILVGFADTPVYGPYHLHHHLRMHELIADWDSLSTWVETLADFGIADHIWTIWVLLSENLQKPQRGSVYRSGGALEVTKYLRLFMQALFRAESSERAWQVFQTIEHLDVATDDLPWEIISLHFSSMPSLSARLYKIVEPRLQNYNEGLISTLTKELKHLENCLGVRWISIGNGPASYYAIDDGRFRGALKRLGTCSNSILNLKHSDQNGHSKQADVPALPARELVSTEERKGTM